MKEIKNHPLFSLIQLFHDLLKYPSEIPSVDEVMIIQNIDSYVANRKDLLISWDQTVNDFMEIFLHVLMSKYYQIRSIRQKIKVELDTLINDATLVSLLDKKRKNSFSKESQDILRSWYDKLRGDPYPTQEQKEIISKSTNLTIKQINSWFTNARRRIK